MTFGWLALGLPGAVFFLLFSLEPVASVRWVAPELFFGLVVVATVLCAVGGVALLGIGWSRSLAEVSILGAALTAASTLSVVHGLTTPGILYGENTATVVSAFVSLPLAMITALPLIAPDWRLSHAIGLRWRAWSLIALLVTAGASMLLLLAPTSIPAPHPRGLLTFVVVGVSLLGTIVLGRRQLELYRIGRRRASLVAAGGFLYLGISALVWLSAGAFSIAWWGAHLIDTVAVLGAIVGLGAAHRRDRSVASILGPVLNRDPLIALELGLTPLVHDFVSALEQKDAVTRDHVVRVGELAMRVGVRHGLVGEQLRALGLGALLHDVGKLLISDGILCKPGKLTSGEFEAMKQHTVIGAELLAASPILAPAARLVRWHHERPDGSGYPDGLAADRIPLEAAIISVCDGWDAMTNARHYRGALAESEGRAILRDGAGAQWDQRAVDSLIAELDEGPPLGAPAFHEVGRGPEQAGLGHEHGCFDALPDSLRGSILAGIS